VILLILTNLNKNFHRGEIACLGIQAKAQEPKDNNKK
jgi:hypothetical protein